jgi:hypothetical protein
VLAPVALALAASCAVVAGRATAREQEVQGAFPPLSMQRLALAPLAWRATRRGRATRYTPEPTATDESDTRSRLHGRHEVSGPVVRVQRP